MRLIARLLKRQEGLRVDSVTRTDLKRKKVTTTQKTTIVPLSEHKLVSSRKDIDTVDTVSAMVKRLLPGEVQSLNESGRSTRVVVRRSQ
jgi:hypothetical protein